MQKDGLMSVVVQVVLLAIVALSTNVAELTNQLVLGGQLAFCAMSILMLSRKSLINAVLFSIATLLIATSFWLRATPPLHWWIPTALLAGFVVLYLLILPQIDHRWGAIAVLGVFLLHLMWASLELWVEYHQWQSVMAFIGSLLCCISALIYSVKAGHFTNRTPLTTCFLVSLVLLTLPYAVAN